MLRLDLYFLIAVGKGLLVLINYCGPPLLLGDGKHLKALFPVLAFGKKGRLCVWPDTMQIKILINITPICLKTLITNIY